MRNTERQKEEKGMEIGVVRTTVLLFRMTLRFDLEDGWREDGFCLAYDKERAGAARDAVLGIARKHQQGAIFEYVYDDHNKWLVRSTLR